MDNETISSATIVACDAFCSKCGCLFAVDLQEVKCPQCGNKNLDKIDISFDESIESIKQKIKGGL